METVGSYKAKTHLPELLDRVARGERIVITRRGQPVAMIVPVPKETRDARQMAKEMLAFRDKHGPRLGDDLSIRQLIEEGRRY